MVSWLEEAARAKPLGQRGDPVVSKLFRYCTLLLSFLFTHEQSSYHSECRAVLAALVWHMGLVNDALTLGHYLSTLGHSSLKRPSIPAPFQQVIDTAYTVLCPSITRLPVKLSLTTSILLIPG